MREIARFAGSGSGFAAVQSEERGSLVRFFRPIVLSLASADRPFGRYDEARARLYLSTTTTTKTMVRMLLSTIQPPRTDTVTPDDFLSHSRGGEGRGGVLHRPYYTHRILLACILTPSFSASSLSPTPERSAYVRTRVHVFATCTVNSADREFRMHRATNGDRRTRNSRRRPRVATAG